MSDLSGIPRPPQDWWQQVPVLRELFKLLSSHEPVNWDLATQVATAIADEGSQAVSLDEARNELEDMSRAAEVQVEEMTGLSLGQVAPVLAVTRSQWAAENISSLRTLIEPLAMKMLPVPEGVPVPEQALQLMRQVSGVLFGMQAGMVLGYLSQHVLGQYELPLPQPSGGRLIFVVPNMVAAEREWELDAKEFRYWIALHEVTHHIEYSLPWTRAFFHEQISTLIDSLDFDPERMQSSLGSFDVSDPDRLAETLQDPELIVQAMWTPQARTTADRLQAFLALAEGYATWAMDAVGASVLKDHPKLREVMDRRKHSRSAGEQLLERLLGLELQQRHYENGVKFCRYVVGVHDIATLNRAWSSADAAPTLAEIADPETWVARTAG